MPMSDKSADELPGESADDQSHPNLSIIVPILNEADRLPDLLEHLQIWQRRGCQTILVDGGSDDSSVELAKRAGFTVITAPRGRAYQMNTGAQVALGQTLLFLHADTRLPDNADSLIHDALNRTASQNKNVVNTTPQWGRFDVNISGDALSLKVVGWLMNQRSRLTAIATGDQGIFVNRQTFQSIDGFPEQPLMEDIELSKALRRITPPMCLEAKVTTSARRWNSKGVGRTILLMWWLRFAYWRGTPAETLAKRYE